MRAKVKFYLPLTLTMKNQVAIELALSIKENNIFSFVNSGTRQRSLARDIREPGTNYSNISHESKTERSSEAVIWQWMLLIG